MLVFPFQFNKLNFETLGNDFPYFGFLNHTDYREIKPAIMTWIKNPTVLTFWIIGSV